VLADLCALLLLAVLGVGCGIFLVRLLGFFLQAIGAR